MARGNEEQRMPPTNPDPDRPPGSAPQLSAVEARQGATPHVVRYVLGVSLAGAIVALLLVFAVS